MQQLPINFLTTCQRCLLAFAAVCMLASPCLAQKSRTQNARDQEAVWQAWRTQPSGEYAPDHRKADPFQSMFSDADLEAEQAKTAPSFLTQFTSHANTAAKREAESESSPFYNPDEYDTLTVEHPEYDADPTLPPIDQALPESIGYAELDELMPQTQPAAPATPQQVFANSPPQCNSCFGWQVLPKGLMYKSYVAGEKEPRMQFAQLHDTRSKTRVWDAVLGGRLGLLRNGNYDSLNPQGFQLDIEGAVFARVLPDEHSAMLAGSDFRAGLLGTHRNGGTAYKWGYYHISSHIGDEFLIANPTFNRINYVRDSLIAGVTQDLNSSTQVYGEIAYALGVEGGAKPLEFQFGGQYQPVAKSCLRGAPYLAANYHIREDFNFHGGVNTLAGWGWQGTETRHRVRIGAQYYNGPSLQYQFLDTWENLYGGGIWFDY